MSTSGFRSAVFEEATSSNIGALVNYSTVSFSLYDLHQSSTTNSLPKMSYCRENAVALLRRLFNHFPLAATYKHVINVMVLRENITMLGAVTTTGRFLKFTEHATDMPQLQLLVQRSSGVSDNVNYIGTLGEYYINTTMWTQSNADWFSTKTMTAAETSTLFNSDFKNDTYSTYLTAPTFHKIGNGDNWLSGNQLTHASLNVTSFSLVYDPTYTGAYTEFLKKALSTTTAQPYVIHALTPVVSYIPPVARTVKLPDVVNYVFPLPQRNEDKDTEEVLYERIASGESMRLLAVENPYKFLSKGENYVMYHGYVKTGFYN